YYDQHTSIPPTITPILLEYEELEWPEQGETWADFEIKEQRERFQKTPINECDILSSGKQLSTASGEGEEINDNKQEQLPSGVIGTMDKSHTVLLSKLYETMKQFQVKRKSQPVSLSSSLLQFTRCTGGLSPLCFYNGTSGGKALFTTSIEDIYQVLNDGGRIFIIRLLEHDMTNYIFGNTDWLWQFMVP
ncbi:unnamed protein product, partial [Didymodactylos carnosus]